MAGEDVIARIKEAELRAAAIVAQAEKESEAIRSAANSDAADFLRRATAESRRSYESSLLVEKEKARQQKGELVKQGRKDIYSEEEKARSRIPASLEKLLSELEDYFNAEAG